MPASISHQQAASTSNQQAAAQAPPHRCLLVYIRLDCLISVSDEAHGLPSHQLETCLGAPRQRIVLLEGERVTVTAYPFADFLLDMLSELGCEVRLFSSWSPEVASAVTRALQWHKKQKVLLLPFCLCEGPSVTSLSLHSLRMSIDDCQRALIVDHAHARKSCWHSLLLDQVLAVHHVNILTHGCGALRRLRLVHVRKELSQSPQPLKNNNTTNKRSRNNSGTNESDGVTTIAECEGPSHAFAGHHPWSDATSSSSSMDWSSFRTASSSLSSTAAHSLALVPVLHQLMRLTEVFMFGRLCPLTVQQCVRFISSSLFQGKSFLLERSAKDKNNEALEFEVVQLIERHGGSVRCVRSSSSSDDLTLNGMYAYQDGVDVIVSIPSLNEEASSSSNCSDDTTSSDHDDDDEDEDAASSGSGSSDRQEEEEAMVCDKKPTIMQVSAPAAAEAKGVMRSEEVPLHGTPLRSSLLFVKTEEDAAAEGAGGSRQPSSTSSPREPVMIVDASWIDACVDTWTILPSDTILATGLHANGADLDLTNERAYSTVAHMMLLLGPPPNAVHAMRVCTVSKILKRCRVPVIPLGDEEFLSKMSCVIMMSHVNPSQHTTSRGGRDDDDEALFGNTEYRCRLHRLLPCVEWSSTNRHNTGRSSTSMTDAVKELLQVKLRKPLSHEMGTQTLTAARASTATNTTLLGIDHQPVVTGAATAAPPAAVPPPLPSQANVASSDVRHPAASQAGASAVQNRSPSTTVSTAMPPLSNNMDTNAEVTHVQPKELGVQNKNNTSHNSAVVITAQTSQADKTHVAVPIDPRFEGMKPDKVYSLCGVRSDSSAYCDLPVGAYGVHLTLSTSSKTIKNCIECKPELLKDCSIEIREDSVLGTVVRVHFDYSGDAVRFATLEHVKMHIGPKKTGERVLIIPEGVILRAETPTLSVVAQQPLTSAPATVPTGSSLSREETPSLATVPPVSSSLPSSIAAQGERNRNHAVSQSSSQRRPLAADSGRNSDSYRKYPAGGSSSSSSSGPTSEYRSTKHSRSRYSRSRSPRSTRSRSRSRSRSPTSHHRRSRSDDRPKNNNNASKRRRVEEEFTSSRPGDGVSTQVQTLSVRDVRSLITDWNGGGGVAPVASHVNGNGPQTHVSSSLLPLAEPSSSSRWGTPPTTYSYLQPPLGSMNAHAGPHHHAALHTLPYDSVPLSPAAGEALLAPPLVRDTSALMQSPNTNIPDSGSRGGSYGHRRPTQQQPSRGHVDSVMGGGITTTPNPVGSAVIPTIPVIPPPSPPSPLGLTQEELSVLERVHCSIDRLVRDPDEILSFAYSALRDHAAEREALLRAVGKAKRAWH